MPTIMLFHDIRQPLTANRRQAFEQQRVSVVANRSMMLDKIVLSMIERLRLRKLRQIVNMCFRADIEDVALEKKPESGFVSYTQIQDMLFGMLDAQGREIILTEFLEYRKANQAPKAEEKTARL